MQVALNLNDAQTKVRGSQAIRQLRSLASLLDVNKGVGGAHGVSCE